MAKFILTVIVVLVIVAGLAIVLNDIKIAHSPSPTVTVSKTPTSTPALTGSSIHVFSPQPNDEVGLPLIIKGEARTFEAAFSYRIRNSRGAVLVEGHGMATNFEVSVNYPDPKTASGSVEVFESSAKDGSEINKVIVPVVFKNIEAMEVKLYLNLDAPIATRIPKTDTPVRATLDVLLMQIGGSVKINSVNLKSGVLTVDLTAAADTTVKSQITKTAMQFSSVKSVIITIDGK